MDHARDVLAAAERLYAAVAAPELWPGALDAIVEFTRGGHGFLQVASAGDAFGAHARVDERDVARLYSPEALRICEPFHRMIRAGISIRNEMISDRDFARSQCYNKLFRPLHGFHSVHLSQANADHFFALTICRDRHAASFSAEEAAKVRAIAPHLASALALRHRLGIAERWSSGLAHTLDRLAIGVILTDATARPVFANARAARIVSEGDGLSWDGAGLAAATPAATQRLRQALLRASESGNGAHLPGTGGPKEQQLRVNRPSGRAPLLLAVLPIWQLDLTLPGVSSPRAILFVTEADASHAIDRAAVTDTFRLTRRETDVALLLAAGCDLADIAAQLGLGRSTVRTHLKRLFQKTDAHSQTALMALVRGFVSPFE